MWDHTMASHITDKTKSYFLVVFEITSYHGIITTWHHDYTVHSRTTAIKRHRHRRRAANSGFLLDLNRPESTRSTTLVRPVAPVLATLSSGRSPEGTVTTLVRGSCACARARAGSVAGSGRACGAVAAVSSVSSCCGFAAAVRCAVAGGRCLAARGAVTLLERLERVREERVQG